MTLRALRVTTVGLAGAVLIAGGPLLARGDAGDPAKGKRLYTNRCQNCHGVSGKGDGRLAETLEPKPPDFTDKEKMSRATEQELKKITLEGKGRMPAYKLSPTDLDDVIAYIRMLAQ